MEKSLKRLKDFRKKFNSKRKNKMIKIVNSLT